MKNERLVSNNLRRRQRGAIGLFAVMTLMIAILFVTLVVDTGRLWMQKRQLQSIADIAAIEAGRSLGCGPDLDDVRATAQAAAVANGFGGTLASSPNIVELGSVATNAAGIRQFDPGNGNEAVRVVATRSVPASLFAGGLINEQVLLSAEAVSIANVPIAVFSAGTTTVSLNNQDANLLNMLLTEVLGSEVELDLIGYKGIADTTVTLAQLIAAQGNVASVDELLDLNLTSREFLELLSDALATTGSAAVATVDTLASAVTKNTVVRLGDVLNIAAPSADGVLDVGINALSLINTAVLVANGQNAIALPIAVNIAGIADVSTSVTVIEPPQIAIGPPAGANGGNACTVARTAQIRVETVVGGGINILGLAGAQVDLKLSVEVAPGEARLQSIEDDGSSTNVAINAVPGIASVKLSNASGADSANVVAKILFIPVKAEILLHLPATQSSPSNLDYEIARPADSHLPQSQSTSAQVAESLENAFGQNSTLEVKALGISLGIVDTILGTLVRPVLVLVAKLLIDPLLKLLGIQLGVLEVNLEDVQLIQPQPLVI